VWRVKPQTAAVEEWIKLGAFGSGCTLGVLVNNRLTCFGSVPMTSLHLASLDRAAAPRRGPGLGRFGGDGNLYVNTFAKGELFRVEVKDGIAGKITKLQPSRPLKFPDGLRSTADSR
jgi:hypothetical protein